MSIVVFSVGSDSPVSLDVRMTAQTAVQIVRRLGAVSGGFLVHALWTECAVNRKDAQAGIDLALVDGNLVDGGNGRLVLGPNAFVPTVE
jgi:hypothetical protein